MDHYFDHVIIGAGRAGLTAADTIREHRPDDSILLINGEDRLPYKRTNLSKKLAAGFRSNDFALQTEHWYTDNMIRLLNGCRAEEVKPGEKLVYTDGGAIYGYGKLLLATGAIPLMLPVPGIELARHFRTAADAEAVISELREVRRVIILGQGVEGVELAEQCRLSGKDVVITGNDDRLMKRLLDENLSGRLLEHFRRAGIECVFNNAALGIEKNNDTIRLSGSTLEIEGELLLVSTGAVPCCRPAASAGLPAASGLVTDEYYRTSVPEIYAAGDVLSLPAGWTGGLWHSAEFQGKAAGLNMAGIPTARLDYPVRAKCEVFGDFFFSMGMGKLRGDEDISGWNTGGFTDDRGNYLKLFSKNGRTLASLMAGMGDRAKLLQNLTAQQRPPEDIAGEMRS